MTKIKICGLRHPCDIAYVNEAKPDYGGFIVNVPRSFRSVTPKAVRNLTDMLSDKILPVGVFVNPTIQEIWELTKDGTLKLVQLHGSESDSFIREVQEKTGVPVIKAFSVSSPEDIRRAEQSPAAYILLDHGQGGTGKVFDWTLLSHIKRPYFLAGGLNPENLPSALSSLRPYGVDLSSGVETEKQKDKEKIHAAVAAVRRISI